MEMGVSVLGALELPGTTTDLSIGRALEKSINTHCLHMGGTYFPFK